MDGEIWGILMSSILHDDSRIRVAIGAEPGVSVLHKFGFNPDVDAAEDIWDYGGDYNWIDTPAALYVSSSEAADDQIIHVIGLDANWEPQNAIAALNGQAQVEIGSGLTWKRVHRAFNVNSSETAGDVYIARSDTLTAGVPDTGSKVHAMIHQAEQQTLMAIYTVPANRTLLTHHWHVTLEGTGSAFLNSPRGMRVALQYRLEGGVFRTHEKIGLITSGSTDYHRHFDFPQPHNGKTDIRIRVQSVTVENAAVAGIFDGLLTESPEQSHS